MKFYASSLLLWLLFVFSSLAGMAESSYLVDIELHEDEKPYLLSIEVEDGFGKKDYDGYLEYPVRFDSKGEPIDYERVGVGFFAEIEIADHDIDKDILLVEYKFQQRTLNGWRSFSGVNIRTPSFSGFSAESKVFSEVSGWIEIPISSVVGSHEDEKIVRLRVRED